MTFSLPVFGILYQRFWMRCQVQMPIIPISFELVFENEPSKSQNSLSTTFFTGAGEKQNDTLNSSWSSCRLLSRSSSSSAKPLLSRRELETKNEPSLSGLGERRTSTAGLASSLCRHIYWCKHTHRVRNLLKCIVIYKPISLISDQTDRVTSTYAQGARPKETTYPPSSSFSSSYSSAARESSLNRHLLSSTSHRSSPLGRDFSTRSTARFLNNSSTLHSSQEQTRNPESSSDISSSSSSSYSSRTPWYTSPLARPEATLPSRSAPEGGEQEGRRSTRHLLSRLFSRRSSQDSSSGSSSIRSLDDDNPSTGGESVDSDEGARMSSVEPDAGGSEASLGVLRNCRADLAPIRENDSNGYRSGSARPRMSLWREPDVSSSNNTSSGGGSNASWLSSSLRGRCPPLLSRLRRHARDESTHSAAGSEESYSRPQHLLRRWDNLEHNASQDDDDDDDDDKDDDEEEGDEDEEEKEGAVGLEAFGAGRPGKLEDDPLPELEDASVDFSPRRRLRVYENMSVPMRPPSGVESQQEGQREKSISSRDQEKLRKIKER